jgi:hypothetical protein
VFYAVAHGTRDTAGGPTPDTPGTPFQDGLQGNYGVGISWTKGNDGKLKVKEIQIEDGGKLKIYERPDQVPWRYRSRLDQMIQETEKEGAVERTKQLNLAGRQSEARPDAAVKKLDKPLQDIPSPKAANPQDPAVTLIPFLRRMVALLAGLLLLLAANYLLFPFFLRALAEAVHAAGLADTYLKLYGIVLGVFIVGFLCCLIPFLPLPVRFILAITMFFITPLGTISMLFFLVMHVVYIKLLLDLRVVISDRSGD